VRAAAIAALVVAVVLAAGFAVQATGLPPTATGNVLAARAGGLLTGSRYVESTLQLDGRTVHGRCFHGWFGGRALRKRHGTVLVLDDGASVHEFPHRRVARGLPPGVEPFDLLAVAGCTHVLGERLAALALFDTSHVRHETFDGRAATAVRFARLTVLVDPETAQPRGVRLGSLRSRIRIVYVTPAVLHELEALR